MSTKKKPAAPEQRPPLAGPDDAPPTGQSKCRHGLPCDRDRFTGMLRDLDLSVPLTRADGTVAPGGIRLCALCAEEHREARAAARGGWL